MKRTRILTISALFIVIALIIAYFTLAYTREGNALIASNFVKNEATYKFDGMPETFRLTATVPMECRGCWEFHFEYQSRNSGYGDREGAVVAPVLTNHSARVVMERGTVALAVLDDAWDMKAQQPYSPAVGQGNGSGDTPAEPVRRR